MNETKNLFERFSANQKKVVRLLQDSGARFRELGLSSAASLIETLQKRVDSERLKVLIVGEFKQGKSTLINALLGAEILPSFGVPCTAVINEIKFGEEKRAVVHFRNPMPASLPEGLVEAARLHIERHAVNSQPIPPLPIEIEQLERFVVISDPAKDHAESVAESPFERVEIFWPIELCRNGVEIIDSPGLNEHGTRTRVTMDYLANVDSVTFVFYCLALAGQTEISFIEQSLRAGGHEEILFACNRFDQVRERERKAVVDYGREKLARLTSFGAEGVFFLSALDALEGRIQHRQELVERSGILAFERRLSAFLTEERGRIKLRQPATRLLLEVNRALNQAIPDQQRMLRESTAEIERRLEEIRPQVEQAQLRCRHIADRLALGRERLCSDARDKVEMFIRQISEEIPAWAAEYKPKNEIKVFSLKSAKQQAKPLVEEIMQAIESRLEAALSKWQKEVLLPYVELRAAEMREGVQESVSAVFLSIESMRRTLVGDETDEKGPGGLERTAATVGGWLLGGPGSAFVGSQLGFKEMLKSLIPAFALAVGALLLSITNPLILLGLFFGGGYLQSLIGTAKITEQIKIKCGLSIAAKMKDQAGSIAKESVISLNQRLTEVLAETETGLQKELSELTEQANAVLQQKRLGEQQAQQRIAVLDGVAASLRDTQTALIDLNEDLSR